MLHDSLTRYLQRVEDAVKTIEGAHVERYEEELLSEDRINLRIRIRFKSGELLEINEAVISEGGEINHLNYRYHFQDKRNKLIFRYDNTPHFPNFDSFPHHKHLLKEVISSKHSDLIEVIKEAKDKLKKNQT